MLCEILLKQKSRSLKFRIDMPIIYELLLAFRSFVNTGPVLNDSRF